MEEISFHASLPDIQSMLSIGKSGARLKIDVPDSDLAQVLKLTLWRERLLEVTVKAVEE